MVIISIAPVVAMAWTLCGRALDAGGWIIGVTGTFGDAEAEIDAGVGERGWVSATDFCLDHFVGELESAFLKGTFFVRLGGANDPIAVAGLFGTIVVLGELGTSRIGEC